MPSDARSPILSAMTARVDVLVVGGGIAGCSVARETALRGWSTLLVERDDLASGTSSRSTKLLHGGLRYLEHGHFRLVREALREREITARLAPHLAPPLGFVVPSRPGSWPPRFASRLGVALYDLLARGSELPRSRGIGREALRVHVSAPIGPEWTGGVLFEDRQTDDARLTIAIARHASRLGARIRTRAEVVDLLQAGGEVTGVIVRDRETGTEETIEAGAVVNACGPSADGLRDRIGASRALLRTSRGTHLVLPPLGLERAVLFAGRKRGHRLFAIPWRGATLFGTTDVVAPPEADAASREEIRLLLDEARRLFPGAGLSPSKVAHVFAGLRPLLRNGGETVTASREHRIVIERGLVTVAGGKLTTWRVLGEDAARAVGTRLGRDGSPVPSSRTRTLPGGDAAFPPGDPRVSGLPPGCAERLLARYGSEAGEVARLAREDPAAGEPLVPDREILAAEIDFAVRDEFARGTEDVLFRRLGLDHDPDLSAAAAPLAAARMRRLLGWSAEREREEVRRVEAALGEVRDGLRGLESDRTPFASRGSEAERDRERQPEDR